MMSVYPLAYTVYEEPVVAVPKKTRRGGMANDVATE
jgi:hypothetical protein